MSDDDTGKHDLFSRLYDRHVWRITILKLYRTIKENACKTMCLACIAFNDINYFSCL